MLYQKKVNRAMDFLKEKNDRKENEKSIVDKVIPDSEGIEDEVEDKAEMELASAVDLERDNSIPLEKNDRLAMILSAFVVFLPFVLIIGVIGAVLIYLITLL